MEDIFADLPPVKRQLNFDDADTEQPSHSKRPAINQDPSREAVSDLNAFAVDSIEAEQRYIIDKLYDKLQNKKITIAIHDGGSYNERRLENYFDRFIKSCCKAITDDDKVKRVNELLYNIYTVIYTKTPIMSTGVQISSFIGDTSIDYIDSCVSNLKLIPIRESEQDRSSKENVMSSLFWVVLNSGKTRIDPKLFFLGTRIDNSRTKKSDKYLPYSNDNTPFMYFLRTMVTRVEDVLNSEDFKNENSTVILTNKNKIETRKYFEKTRNVKVGVNITGCRDSDFFKFDNDPDSDRLKMEMISKPFNIKIENHEVISFANSIQVKVFYSEDNGVDASVYIWNKFGFII